MGVLNLVFNGYSIHGIGKIVQNRRKTSVAFSEGVRWYVEGVLSRLWAILTFRQLV